MVPVVPVDFARSKLSIQKPPTGTMPAPAPTRDEETSQANLPKGVVLDKDGKPYVSNTKHNQSPIYMI